MKVRRGEPPRVERIKPVAKIGRKDTEPREYRPQHEHAGPQNEEMTVDEAMLESYPVGTKLTIHGYGEGEIVGVSRIPLAPTTYTATGHLSPGEGVAVYRVALEDGRTIFLTTDLEPIAEWEPEDR